ncbi:MAG: PilN domain-containing protein [Phycisphaerales bacterium]|nr:PilN domain-containing protein [Phycisphaerales bacterium]
MRIKQGYSATGMLPPDEIKRASEVRMNFLMLVLFAVVMVAVFGAFLVTNRQWSQVRVAQRTINAEFEHATERIRELQELERQQQQMVSKAVLAASLIERVPRSILLAELINRMPERLSLLEFEIRSEEYKAPKPKDSKEADGKTGSLKKPERAKTKEQAIAEADKEPEPVRYLVSISMLGAAPNDTDVSRYMSALSDHPLLKNVRLEFSEAKDVDGRQMRQFRIGMRLDLGADVRQIDPLIVQRRIGNPMDQRSPITYEGVETQAAATEEN